MEDSTTKENFTSYFKTHIPEHSYKLKWDIENFSGLCKNILLQSPIFQLVPGQDWKISLANVETPYIYLICDEIVKANIYSNTSFLDEKGKVLYSYCHQFTQQNSKINEDLLPNSGSMDSNLMKNLPNDILVITFHLKLYLPAQTTIKSFTTKFEDKLAAFEKAQKDFKNMFDSSAHSDIILMVQGVSLKAHKTILCARSPVFAKMFDHNFQENVTSFISIEDIEEDTMKKLISLFYYPVLGNDIDFDTACDLYYAADKYEVLEIRDIIGTFMLNQLHENNCLHLFEIAHLHEDDFMKSEVVNFFNFHIENIIASEIWQEFHRNKFQLASFLISNILSKGKK